MTTDNKPGANPGQCPGQCDGCAFRAGATANQEPYNAFRAIVAAMGMIPFFCHHSKTGADLSGQVGQMTREQARHDGLVVCQGWAAKVKELRALGYYDTNRAALRAVAQHAMNCTEALAAKDVTEEQKRDLIRPELKLAFDLLASHYEKVSGRQRKSRKGGVENAKPAE